MNQVYLNTDLLVVFPFKRNPLLVFLVHWLAWLVLHFIAYSLILINSKIGTGEFFVYTHLAIPTVNFLLFYLIAFFVMPKMTRFRQKWFWIVAASLILAVLFTYMRFCFQEFYTQYMYNKYPELNKFSRKPIPLEPFSYSFKSYFQREILINISVVVTAFAYRLLLLWFQQEKIRKELENQKLKAELSFLKMQVNPHFLFNALNNIYSLSVMEKSKKTGDSIMKLSELMRYVLYEKEDSENKVSLNKEIRHINSYIDLEKLRHPGDVFINFSIEGNTNEKRVAPLLLFPLIENACKHGILTDPQKPVNIQLDVKNGHLKFSIENFNNGYVKDQVGGIGIPNVQKRLELLYGKEYTLDVWKTEDKFLVNLQLPL